MTPNAHQHMHSARELGTAAGERCADKAEAASPEFRQRALEFLRAYAAEHQRFTGEDCTLAMREAGIRAHDDRATGPVYARAIREGVIRVVGTVPRVRGHGSAGGKLYAAGRQA